MMYQYDNMNSSVNEIVSFNTTTISTLLSKSISNNTLTDSEQEIIDTGGNLTESHDQCNKSVYFECPDPDPILQACASITLQSEIQVNKTLEIPIKTFNM